MIKPTEKAPAIMSIGSKIDVAEELDSFSDENGDYNVVIFNSSISDAIVAGQKRYLDENFGSWSIVHRKLGAARYEERYFVPALSKKSPAALPPESNTTVRVKFERYRNAWQAKTATMSSLAEMVMLDEYQHIIGLGRQAVPFLIEELRHELDHWFWALKAIVGEDHASHASTMREAAAMWIAWYDDLPGE
ncbi:hypothetical protein [Mycobacterium paragordonae]|uniref:Uncharacterized protein n=1 Tax=Mycobacterium paragordonae TaxID=1389713 RepID=A0AAJ1W429_9MYCO|nr:hypothetical protein [Mycobacterium paragordonae]MDP7738995.1 hypothetical protein [Mycobacterium paragordonae]TDK97425.1 hypothetical protein EUA05_31825 [Mycobacterium paragordonae]